MNRGAWRAQSKGGKQLATSEGLSTHRENWSWEEGVPLTTNSHHFHKDKTDETNII